MAAHSRDVLLQRRYKKLDALKAEEEAIRAEGDCILDARLKVSHSGGTASDKAKHVYHYARLCAIGDNRLANGCKTMYVPKSRQAEVEAACDRGMRLRKIFKKRDRLLESIRKLEDA